MKSAAALSHRVNVQPVADCVTSVGLLCLGRSDAATCMAAVSAAGSAARVHWNACHCWTGPISSVDELTSCRHRPTPGPWLRAWPFLAEDRRDMRVRVRFSAPHKYVGHLCHCSGIHSHLSELPCSLVKHIPTAKMSSLNIPAKFHASSATRIFKNYNAVTPRDESIKCFLVAQFFAVFWCFCVKLQAMHIALWIGYCLMRHKFHACQLFHVFKILPSYNHWSSYRRGVGLLVMQPKQNLMLWSDDPASALRLWCTNIQ
jgi:hypothetical protein